MNSSWDSTSIRTLMGSNNGLAGMIGDYNSIRSGSYGKLLKSYYGQVTSETSSSAKKSLGSDVTERLIKERHTPPAAAKDKQDTATVKSSKDLKGSISRMMSDDIYEKTKDSDGKEAYDVKSISSAAEDFVKNYNATIESAKKSTVSGVTGNLSAMMKKTTQNSDALASIGIKAGSDGKLSIDKTTFEKADMARVSDVFKKYGSAISQNADRLNFYSTSQNTAAGGYSASGAYSSDNLVSSLFSGTV